MGGGQPLDAGAHTREARMQGLYKADVNTQIKKSDEIRWYSLCMKDF